jgi:hypothetical protein
MQALNGYAACSRRQKPRLSPGLPYFFTNKIVVTRDFKGAADPAMSALLPGFQPRRNFLAVISSSFAIRH